ncbi:LysR family transcriptional regulator [Paraburkholderia monticola]|uniref:LysR family transcriptional regulator n=1 Tax=Paraburkholderia monticola TaxID=1399968 RepID=A0A149PB35_9BURK|nr:LysR family transcriptional regulator [Paraburkholderia monticola]KXU82237.1 LysR family transcriptional regulator [Paraburkholderia monticola]
MDKLAAMQAFVRVVDAGTFTRAADLMNVPKSTVTRLVQALEHELGVKLLHRTSRQLTLTQQGQVYYEGSIRLLDEVGSLDSSVLSATRSPRGKIKVELPASLAYHVVIPALPDFFARYPDVQVEMNVGNRSVDLIAENLDCVLRLGPILNDSLVAKPAGALPLFTCASPAYLERQGVPRHPADLAKDHTVVRMTSPRSGRDFAFQLTRDGATTEVRGSHQITVNDSGAALAAGLAGLGVLTTYAFLVAPHLQSGALQRLFPDWQGDQIPAHVAYPVNRHLASKVRVFVDWAIELLRSMQVAG